MFPARCFLPLLFVPLLYAGQGADLARQIAQADLDPAECYRVRDLTLTKDDLRLYFTDGHLLFGKHIGDEPVTAVFLTSVQGGDAEILTLPPTRGERRSLASFTNSPNLDEHFKVAVLLFTDQTYRELMEQIRQNPSNKKNPEMGLTIAPQWSSVAHNLAASFVSRLLLDLLSGPRQPQAFFFAALAGKELGNFDAIYDARSLQQITIGQTAYRNDRMFFDVWTAFEARPVRNGLRPAPKPEFSLDNFRIDATLRAPDMRLQAVTRVKVRQSGRGSVFPFELSRRMHVSAALVDGKPAEVFEAESLRSNLIHDRGNDLFLVIPAQPLAPGGEYEFEIHHEGAVIADMGNKVYAVGARSNWYPNRGLQFAKFDVTFHYPRDLDLVATGDIISDSIQGDLRVTERRTPAPARVAGFNLGYYERARIVRGGETIEVCANRNLERALQPKPEPAAAPITPPLTTPRRRPITPMPGPGVDPGPGPMMEAAAPRLRELASDVAAALEFMSARFGPPPLPTLTVSPAPGVFGQGFPGLIYLSTLSYVGASNRTIARMRETDQLFFSEMLYAHEVAHQWWGNVVASAGYQHDWLLEALADYSALLYLEKHKGVRAVESVLNQYRTDLLAKTADGSTMESTGPIALGYRLESSFTPNAWRTIVYEKGVWILHMLRRRMGDEQFDAFLGELRRQFEWKSIDTESFRLLAARFLPPQSTDPKLDAFFDQWVYSTGIPALKMTSSLTGKIPRLKLTVTVEQSGVDEDFSAAVPVEIQFRRAKTITRVARTGAEPAVFTIEVSQPPAKVSLDPTNSILSAKK